MDGKRVVVSGMGIVCAVGAGLPEVREALREGRDGIAPITAFPVDGIRSSWAGEVKALSANGAEEPRRKPADRNSVLALAAARETFSDSGFEPTDEEREEIGTVMGSCGGGYLNGLAYLDRRRRAGRGAGNLLLDLPLHAAASRIAAAFQLQGGINVVSNACASSAIAFACAADRVRSGGSVAMLAGGYEALSPLNCAGFGVMRNSSPTNRVVAGVPFLPCHLRGRKLRPDLVDQIEVGTLISVLSGAASEEPGDLLLQGPAQGSSETA